MDNIDINHVDEKKDENDLEDLQLPPLTSHTSFDYYYNITNSSGIYGSQNGIIFNNDLNDSANSNSIENCIYSEEMDSYNEKLFNPLLYKDVEDNVSMTIKKCIFCQKKHMLRNMFTFKNDNNDMNMNLICLKCSSNISESRLLKDWEKEPNSAHTNVCKRCNKEKSCYRFKNGNKYCDYCLLKKRWSRLRMKIEYENGKDDDNDEEDETNSISKSKRYVECCFCNERMIMNECFRYYEHLDDVYSYKTICLNCSLNIKDWRCLRDWEDSSEIKNGRVCTRCKKIKSKSRFKVGKSGCEYCSLKRKRMYLMSKH